MDKKESSSQRIDIGSDVTDNLFEKLQDANDISLFVKANANSFVNTSLKDYIEELFRRYKLKKSQIIIESGLNEIYTYQIMAGKKNPSRNKLLALAVAMKLNVEECQKLLKFGGVNELYPRNRRDAIIIFALTKKLSIFELNELLFDLDEFIL